jgi:hypothetical protein
MSMRVECVVMRADVGDPLMEIIVPAAIGATLR